MGRVLIASLVLLLAAGCATSERVQATHYWESSASKRQYDVDNRECEQRSLADADSVLDPNSPSFESYKDCMIEQGYTLRQY